MFLVFKAVRGGHWLPPGWDGEACFPSAEGQKIFSSVGHPRFALGRAGSLCRAGLCWHNKPGTNTVGSPCFCVFLPKHAAGYESSCQVNAANMQQVRTWLSSHFHEMLCRKACTSRTKSRKQRSNVGTRKRTRTQQPPHIASQVLCSTSLYSCFGKSKQARRRWCTRRCKIDCHVYPKVSTQACLCSQSCCISEEAT